MAQSHSGYFLFFFPKFGRWWNLWMLFCHPMTAGWEVGILRGGGDTQTLPAVIEKKIKRFGFTGGGNTKISLVPLYTLVPACMYSHPYNQPTWWNFHCLILILCLSQGLELAKKTEPFSQVLASAFLVIRVSSLHGVPCTLISVCINMGNLQENFSKISLNMGAKPVTFSYLVKVPFSLQLWCWLWPPYPALTIQHPQALVSGPSSLSIPDSHRSSNRKWVLH